ncbi:SDR family oxidoreductase [Nocardioides sp.]|uniref:SDR family NAD(P)-dependent oxidoreductase n=1 Tax=Nocardioides sp. TaxID=35761 RepID=UPI002617A679|nr:SDR family oxidoreductase [Nocardioides sp.]
MARRTVVITGGTRGIGRACAERLAREGYDLVLGYADDDQAAAATREEIARTGVRCTVVRADLTSEHGVDELFAAAEDATRGHESDAGLHGVVNNAGATLHIGTLVDTPVDLIRRVVELNLTAAILVARRAAQVLPDGGVLVNISSGAATTGSPGEYVHYAAAKAGVDALTKGLALEVATRGIRVVGVAPGIIDTALHAAAGDPGRVARLGERHPMGRVGRPDEVADVVAFALSEAAGFISGTTLRVAGGA